jgi:ankyrin repeat protein
MVVRTLGAGMASSLGLRVAALLLMLSTAAISQELGSSANFKAAPNTIESIPPLARAVMSGDREQFAMAMSKAISERENVNDQVRAKDGARAGYTPLIIAASLSDPDIVKMLIQNGAKTTVFDDFHRSAFWYAALRQNLPVSQVLVTAPDAEKAINVADNDLKRTPLHLAVRGNSADLVKLLLSKGASASKEQRDILGETPLDYCKFNMTGGCKPLF